jgi:hypothetical protein
MKAVDDIISTRMNMGYLLKQECFRGENPKGFKIKPLGLLRVVLILALLLTLAGCSPVSPKNKILTQEASAKTTVSPDSARATTLARQAPAALFSAGPESAVEITTTAQNAAATAAPTALPSATPTRTRLPLQSSDLLYLATNPNGQSALMRWDHFTGYSGLLADNVELFSVSADGQKIILLRPHNVSGNGQALYDLDVLDYATMQTAALLEQISYPIGWQFPRTAPGLPTRKKPQAA